MPWCEECSRFYTPSTLTPGGDCPEGHHVADPDAAVAELARVVRPGGVVLLRELFADMPAPGRFASFPGIERAMARYPSTPGTVARFAAAGFEHLSTTDVTEAHHTDDDGWRRFVTEMRHTDFLLVALTDDEVAAGLDADPVPHEVTLRLLAFRIGER